MTYANGSMLIRERLTSTFEKCGLQTNTDGHGASCAGSAKKEENNELSACLVLTKPPGTSGPTLD